MAASMGLLGNPMHADVRALIERTIRDIGGAGKAPGVYCTDETLAHHYVRTGARFVALGADSSILAAATAALAKRFRSGSVFITFVLARMSGSLSLRVIVLP